MFMLITAIYLKFHAFFASACTTNVPSDNNSLGTGQCAKFWFLREESQFWKIFILISDFFAESEN